MMSLRSVLLGILAAVLGSCKLGFAEAAPEGVLEALTAKTADIRDYHYRMEWALLGGVRVYTIEYWYGGLDRVRITMTYGTGTRPMTETLIKGDEVYTISGHQYEVTKAGGGDRQQQRHRYMGEFLGPVYLTAEQLALWEKATLTGTETVGGAICQIVDLGETDATVRGSLQQEEDDFVAFIPSTGRSSSAVRLWVDAETGMVRRWSRVYGGRVRQTTEVTETRQVNGFEFPSVIELTGGGVTGIARITEAEVNQGVEEAIADFNPPPNWLVRDETLSVAEVRERLEADPDDASLHYTLGMFYQRRQRRDEAAAEFRRAAELAPESPTPLLGLTQPDGDHEADVDILRQAVERAGDDAWFARMRLAEALKRADRIDEAIAEYRELATAGAPLSFWIMGSLAEMLAKKGDFEGAYRTAADVPLPVLGVMGSEAGSIIEWAAKSDHLDDLRAKAEQAVAAEPESVAARLLLVKALQAQGRREEAAQALRAMPPGAESGQFLGGRQDAALELAALARELGEEELAVRVQQAALREAIKSGSGWRVSRAFGDDQPADAVLAELIHEAAALWAEAPDAQSRATILDGVTSAVQSLRRRNGEEEVALTREPEQMTPAECAIAGAVAAALADRANERAEMAEARRLAEACWQRALTEWPNDAALWAKVGRLRWSARAWEETVDAYGKAAAADPDEIEYPARVAFALARMDQCDRALETGRKAIEPWAEEWGAKAFFASLQMDCGQFQPARDTLIAVRAESEPDMLRQPSVGRLLARCHERLGELEQAEAILKAEVEETEEWRQWEAYQRLIRFYARHERREDAYAAAKALYARGEPRGWERRSAVREAQRAFDDDAEALAGVVRADLEAHPDDADAVEFAAAVFERIAKPDEALPLLVDAAAKADNAEVWIRVADMAERADKDELVTEALHQALQLRPDDADLRRRYARAAAEQGDPTAAKALADELRATIRDSAGAWWEVADLYLTAESWDDALAAAERVLALTPETDETGQMRAQVLLARAYAGKRDDHEARKRLIPILARAQDRDLLQEAADALVNLYLLREERDQAIATLNDLRLRTQDRRLQYWVDQRLREIAGEEPATEE